MPSPSSGKEATEMLPLPGVRAFGSRMQKSGKETGFPSLRGTRPPGPGLSGKGDEQPEQQQPEQQQMGRQLRQQPKQQAEKLKAEWPSAPSSPDKDGAKVHAD